MLRACDRDRRLLCDELCNLQRRCSNLIAATLHNARDKAHLLRLGGGEVTSGVRKLVHQAVITGDLGDARERPDVCRQADVHFLQGTLGIRRP